MSPRMRKSAYLDRLGRVPMFAALSKRDLQLIGRNATPHQASKGDKLTEEGKPGFEFFVIAGGKATVKRRGRKVAALKTGDFFGEIALLERLPRNASVIADTDMELWVLDGREFMGVLREVPEIAVKLLSALAKRLAEADAKSIH